MMGTELVTASLKEDELEFPSLPPGFESFTSFKLQKIEKSDVEPICSVSSNFSQQDSVHVKSEPNHGGTAKITRPLRRRSGVNYGRLNQCSDEESDSEQNIAPKPGLPKGVIRGCSECSNCQKVTARWRPKAARRPDLEDVPVFYPTEEEFNDTIKYIEQIRPKAEPYGICRIIPPPSWKPPCPLRETPKWESSKFATRVQKVDKLQNRDVTKKKLHAKKRRRKCSRMGVDNGTGSGKSLGLEEVGFGFEPGPDFTLQDFQKYAYDFKSQYFRTESSVDTESVKANPDEKLEQSVETIEGEYWRVVENPTEEIEVLYGADLETGVFGSGFPKIAGQDCSSSDDKYIKSGWNLNNLPRLPGSVLSYENGDISGVQVPWLYVGMCFSSFCWHVEDHHLYSLNYMHFGAPKMWYGVPGTEAIKLEETMKKYLPDLFDEQPDLLHKLVTQLSPSILKAAGVPVYRCVQKEGEFVLTFPRAYHSGFNCGFNCAEAVNVAPLDWFPHGQKAVELYREQGRKTTISHDKLLLGAAREAVRANWELNLLRKNTTENLRWKGVCGREGILAKSLRARVEMENVRREYLCNFSKALKMENSFDATTERECFVCSFDLHLSAAGCHCAPDRYACLNHAKQLCSCGWDDIFFLFRYDVPELNVLVDALEGKLSAVYRWARLDLGLALSSCIAKDNGQVVGLIGAFPEHPVESYGNKANLQPLATLKSKDNSAKVPTDKVNKLPSSSQLKLPETVLALEATKIPVIKIIRPNKRKGDQLQVNKNGAELASRNTSDRADQLESVSNKRLTKVEPQMKPSSLGQNDVICLSDDEDEPSNKTSYDARKENICPDVPEMVEGSDHKLNLCDLANAALAAEGKLMSDGQKDDCLSCSTSPKDEIDVKCEIATPSDEPNLSCQQGSIGSSADKREPDASTPESFVQTLPGAPTVGRGTSLLHRSDMKVLDDARLLPGSPSCSQSSVDIHHRQKGPRIAKVVRRINCNVEPLEFGTVIPGNLWSNSRAIFPKGFKSRVRYINILDPTNQCSYISEIADGGSRGPLFMVFLENCPDEVYIHASPTKCWEMVRERANQEISKQHKLGKVQLPPLQPPGSLDGLEMFGFTSPAIVQAIEALDKNRVANEYWSSRPLAHFSRCFQSRENRNPSRKSDGTSQGAETVLRGLLKKASPVELNSLTDILSNNHSLVTKILNEEVQNRSR